MHACGHTEEQRSVLNAKLGYTVGGKDMDRVGELHEHRSGIRS